MWRCPVEGRRSPVPHSKGSPWTPLDVQACAAGSSSGHRHELGQELAWPKASWPATSTHWGGCEWGACGRVWSARSTNDCPPLLGSQRTRAVPLTKVGIRFRVNSGVLLFTP